MALNRFFFFLIVLPLLLASNYSLAEAQGAHRILVPSKTGPNLWGLVDDNGELIAPPVYASMADFNGNYTQPINVQGVDGKWGYLSADGALIHKLELDQARGFTEEGFARFELNGKWGFLKTDGSYLVEPSYDDASYFSNGYAAVKQGDEWFFIDVRGERTSDKSFFHVGTFGKSGLASASKTEGSKIGFIDPQGNWQIKPQFQASKAFFDSGTVLVKKNDLWGLIDSNGKWLVKPTYKAVDSLDEKGFAKVNTDSYITGGIINDRGELIIDMGEKDIDWLVLVSQCDIAYYLDAYLGETRFFNLVDGKELKSFNEKDIGISSSFNHDCFALAFENSEKRWARLSSSGDLFHFDSDVIEPLFDQSTEVTSYENETGYFSPVLTKDRSLAYVDYKGQTALKTQVIKQDEHDIFIVQNMAGKELWRYQYQAGTLVENEKYTAFLNLGDAEVGYQKPDQALIKAQLKELEDSEPVSLDVSGSALVDEDGDGFGTAIRLADARYAYSDHAYYYYSVFDRGDMDSRFDEYKSGLTELLGEPLEKNEKIENVLYENGVYGYKDAIWKLGEKYLVLHDAYYEDGDVDYFAILNLLLLPTPESRRAINDIPFVSFEQVSFAEKSSAKVLTALEKMQNEMTYSTAINLRSAVVAVLDLLEVGEKISRNDYLKTQHALIFAAYYDGEEELEIGTVEQYVAVSENIMRFVEKLGFTENVLTADVQFRRNAYRYAANGAAWLLHDTEPARAVNIVEPAMAIVNDADSFLYDTYARALLEAGQENQAYAVIKKTFDENPWYTHFWDFYTDEGYLAWLKKNGHDKPAIDEAPSTSDTVRDKQELRVHVGAGLLAIYWFDQIQLFDLATGKRLHTMNAETYDPFTFKFSSDGTKLISSGWDITNIWDTNTGKRLKKQRVQGGNSEHAGVSANQSYFYYDNEGEFRVNGLTFGRTKLSLSGIRNSNSSSDERFIAVASDLGGEAEINIIDLEHSKVVQTLTGEQASPYDDYLFFVNQNTQLLVRDYSDFYLWDIKAGKVVQTWDTDSFDVEEVAVLDDQLIILERDSFERRVWVYGEEPGNTERLPIPAIPGTNVLSIEISSNKEFYSIAVGIAESNLTHVFVIDRNSDEVLSEYITANGAYKAEFANNDQYLVLNGYPVEVVDWAKGTKVYELSR